MPVPVHVNPSAQPGRLVSISIVSHRHGALVHDLLHDIERCCTEVEVLLTVNVEEALSFDSTSFEFPLRIINNKVARGFGANHNAAFVGGNSPFFCVANPDVRLKSDPFTALMKAFNGDRVAVAGPLVRAPDGRAEDSARRFPTPYSLLRKLFLPSQGPDYPTDGGLTEVDWVAGMFMLFDRRAFRDVRGFDEGYFMYYEDADICRRLGALRRSVVYVPEAEIIHEARRASRRDAGLARHHIASALRFLTRRG